MTYGSLQKGYKTSQTASIPSPFTPLVAWLLDHSVFPEKSHYTSTNTTSLI
jgi:hypothetical protein